MEVEPIHGVHIDIEAIEPEHSDTKLRVSPIRAIMCESTSSTATKIGGQGGNRTHHSYLAKVSRRPWNILAHIILSLKLLYWRSHMITNKKILNNFFGVNKLLQ